MKRLSLLMMTLCAFVMASAQSKLTPQALLRMSERSALVKRIAKTQGMEKAKDNGDIRLVVKLDDGDAAPIFAQIRGVGARIESRLGRQAVVRLPLDSVAALSRIPGVTRIDAGHQPRWKTDIVRKETGVDQLNTVLSSSADPQLYTGEGVTICLIDVGFDFQHIAFKGADGQSRIKAVYLMGDDKGHPFSVEDPDAGTITFPGSVYDTPELIATLTTDDAEEYHGTHTAGIAAGMVSPIGFGGMAPGADIVLIPYAVTEAVADEYDFFETALSFATAYAKKSGKPMVLSCSANSHTGPHDGTGTIPEAIEEASSTLIPVFSAGNEGGYPVHLYRKFSNIAPSVKTLLAMMESEDGVDTHLAISDEVAGYTRSGDKVSIQLSLYNPFNGKTIWSSDTCTATPGCEPTDYFVSSTEDTQLAKYFDGLIGLSASDLSNGRLGINAMIEGTTKNFYLVSVTVSGSAGTEIDLWDNLGGFYNYGLRGFAQGSTDITAGDWTSIPSVVSVGAYCTNTTYRGYDMVKEQDEASYDPEEDDPLFHNDELAWFSSSGTMFNGVIQPVVCAPGVNVVSAFSHYCLSDTAQVLENMQWVGNPYCAESGTSMSCPVVSGIVALWLQAKPSLTLSDVMTIMKETCRNDEHTLAAPAQFGYGKIDAPKGIDYILTHLGISPLPGASSPVRGDTYDLMGRKMPQSHQLSKGIYIKDGKKIVIP